MASKEKFQPTFKQGHQNLMTLKDLWIIFAYDFPVLRYPFPYQLFPFAIWSLLLNLSFFMWSLTAFFTLFFLQVLELCAYPENEAS